MSGITHKVIVRIRFKRGDVEARTQRITLERAREEYPQFAGLLNESLITCRAETTEAVYEFGPVVAVYESEGMTYAGEDFEVKIVRGSFVFTKFPEDPDMKINASILIRSYIAVTKEDFWTGLYKKGFIGLNILSEKIGSARIVQDDPHSGIHPPENYPQM